MGSGLQHPSPWPELDGLSEGGPVANCIGHAGIVAAVAVTPDNRRILSGGGGAHQDDLSPAYNGNEPDSTIRVWLLDGTPESTLELWPSAPAARSL